MINKKDYKIPEKRELSVIVLPNDLDKQTSYLTLVKELESLPISSFEEKALELSIDSSKDLNKGHWGEFRKKDFNYSFKESVFADDEGVIQQLFEQGDKKYIVRVNKIIPSKIANFSDVKEEIIEKIQEKKVSQEFQNIINQKAIHQIEVNAELVAQVFERYKVFVE